MSDFFQGLMMPFKWQLLLIFLVCFRLYIQPCVPLLLVSLLGLCGMYVPGLVWIKEMKNTFQGCCLPSRHTHGILQHAHAFKPALVAISVERAPVYGGLVVCLPWERNVCEKDMCVNCRTCRERPPVYYCHFLYIPWVASLHRFDCSHCGYIEW